MPRDSSRTRTSTGPVPATYCSTSQHEFDGAAPVAAPAQRSAVLDTVRGIDRAIGAIAGALEPEDVLLIASDHGFEAGDVRNVWVSHFRARLARLGIDPKKEGFAVVGEFGTVTLRVLPPISYKDNGSQVP